MIYFRDFVPSSTTLPKPDPLQRAQNQLNRGDILFSATRNFQLMMQDDGNLVLYAIDDKTLPPSQLPAAPATIAGAAYSAVIWASNTAGLGATRCNMQTDGNLVIYDGNNVALWASGTNGNPGAFLRCQDDGNLVLIASNGAVLKSSNTYAGQR